MLSIGSAPLQIIRNNYASNAVTTAAYTELDSAINGNVYYAEIYDSSGSAFKLAVGPSGSESDILYVMPSGNGYIPLRLDTGVRLSIKAVDTNASTGQLLINLFR